MDILQYKKIMLQNILKISSFYFEIDNFQNTILTKKINQKKLKFFNTSLDERVEIAQQVGLWSK